MARAPWLHVEVSMDAIFPGASRAFLNSVVFAFKTTQQPYALLPLLGARAAAYMVSGLMMRNTIMTDKIVRGGVRVPSKYSADYLNQVLVRDACSRDVARLQANRRISDVRDWLGADVMGAKHRGFPVLDASGRLAGVVTRRDLSNGNVSSHALVGSLICRPPLVVEEAHSLREAADHMVEPGVRWLVAVGAEASGCVIGIITRGDLLAAHAQRLREARYFRQEEVGLKYR